MAFFVIFELKMGKVTQFLKSKIAKVTQNILLLLKLMKFHNYLLICLLCYIVSVINTPEILNTNIEQEVHT